MENVGLKQYAEQVLQHLEGLAEDIEVIKVNVQLDHVHMVIVIPPRVSVAQTVQYIKSRSAKELKTKFPSIKRPYGVAKESGLAVIASPV